MPTPIDALNCCNAECDEHSDDIELHSNEVYNAHISHEKAEGQNLHS
jgi:hypothetical protein